MHIVLLHIKYLAIFKQYNKLHKHKLYLYFLVLIKYIVKKGVRALQAEGAGSSVQHGCESSVVARTLYATDSNSQPWS